MKFETVGPFPNTTILCKVKKHGEFEITSVSNNIATKIKKQPEIDITLYDKDYKKIEITNKIKFVCHYLCFLDYWARAINSIGKPQHDQTPAKTP